MGSVALPGPTAGAVVGTGCEERKMALTCEHCGHDWHGLECRHEVVERDGWWLTRTGCSCPGAGAAVA